MAEDTRNPTSDDAVSGTWTGSAGSRFGVVDDYPDTTGADELTHGTTAGNLTFGFSAFSVPAGSTSISVLVDYYDYKNGSQGSTIGARLKIGGTYHNASTHNPANGSANRTQRTDTFATNPKTAAAWTVDDVNGVGSNPLQAFGWVSTDASPTVTLSSIRVRVSYTPLAARDVVATVTGPAATASAGLVREAALSSTATGPAATAAAALAREAAIASAATGPAATASAALSQSQPREVSAAVTGPAATGAGALAREAVVSAACVGPAATASGALAGPGGGPPNGTTQRSGRRMNINRGSIGI